MPKRPADRPSIPPSRHRPSPAAPIPSRNRTPELSPPPPPPPPPAETFRDAVAAIKAIADAQAWRTAALRRQPLWREFAVHWLSIAPSMLDAVGDGPLETRGLPLDERVAVCWAATGALTDAALSLLAERSALCEADVLFIFDALQSAVLLYPDGTIHRGMQQLLDSAEQARVYSAGLRAFRAARAVAAEQAAVHAQRNAPTDEG